MTVENRPWMASVRAWRDAERSIDRSGMRAHVARFPAHLAAGTETAKAFVETLGSHPGGPIVVTGMGGSAIGGDLAAAYTADRRRRSLSVVRGYALPVSIDKDAIVIVSSYSGDTEETVACYADACERGLAAIAVTTGGEICRLATVRGDPVFTLPTGFPPRAALGHSFSAVAMIVAALDPGLDPAEEADALDRAAETLAPLAEPWLDWDVENPTLDIAGSAVDGLTVVYGGHPISIAAASRWKAQLNENGKLPAFAGALPEQNHNEIVGFEADHPATRLLVLIHLETPWDHPRVRRRFDFLYRFSEDRVAQQFRIDAREDEPLSGMLRLCYLGDCVSFLASIIGGQDPTPVVSIDALKNELKG